MNLTGGTRGFNKQYKISGSGIRRHEVIFPIAGMDPIALGEYATTILCKFKRSFDASADGLPTATASNNFETATVMNGSKITKFTAKVKISNQGSSAGVYLDVYSVT